MTDAPSPMIGKLLAMHRKAQAETQGKARAKIHHAGLVVDRKTIKNHRYMAEHGLKHNAQVACVRLGPGDKWVHPAIAAEIEKASAFNAAPKGRATEANAKSQEPSK